MNWFQHLLNGHTAAARMLLNGIKPGDTVFIDPQTAPTNDRKCVIKATVKSVNKDGTFNTHEADPYFGYTENWSINQIVE